MALARGTLTTSLTPVYISVGDTALTNAYFCNITGANVTIDIHLASDGTMGDITNVIYKSIMIPAFNTYVMDTEKIVLSDGDAVYAVASSNNAIVATFSFMRI